MVEQAVIRLQAPAQFRLTCRPWDSDDFVHEGHHSLCELKPLEEVVGDLSLNVDQRIADTENVVLHVNSSVCGKFYDNARNKLRASRLSLYP